MLLLADHYTFIDFYYGLLLADVNQTFDFGYSNNFLSKKKIKHLFDVTKFWFTYSPPNTLNSHHKSH